MELDDLDLELLEVLALEVPWYMVCGDFHLRYGSAEALVARLFALSRAGLLDMRSADISRELSPAALVADAQANGCYEDIENAREPVWIVVATDKGFAAVERRLERQ